MRKNLLALGLLCSFVFSGCASEPLNSRVSRRWVGASKEELIKKHGPPDQIFTDPLGNETFSYSIRGGTESTKYNFTIDSSSGKITFVRLKRFIEDRAQVDLGREEIKQRRKGVEGLGEAFGKASRGANAP